MTSIEVSKQTLNNISNRDHWFRIYANPAWDMLSTIGIFHQHSPSTCISAFRELKATRDLLSLEHVAD